MDKQRWGDGAAFAGHLRTARKRDEATSPTTELERGVYVTIGVGGAHAVLELVTRAGTTRMKIEVERDDLERGAVKWAYRILDYLDPPRKLEVI